MPDLVEEGHLYVAKPPLCRLKDGKKEAFFHNEDSYNSYLIDRISERETVREDGRKDISRKRLRVLLYTLIDYLDKTNTLRKKGYSSRFLNLICKKGINKDYTKDKDLTISLSKELEKEAFTTKEIIFDEEHNRYELLLLDLRDNGSIFRFNWELLTSPEFQKLLSLNEELKDMGGPFFLVGDKKGQTRIETKEELVEHLVDKAKKGVVIQRYKGLGEMNPEQLWQTTMDPERRSLVRVTVEDAVAADEIFTLLMGDKVEPRREFIQNNALEVTELDI
jgi:DNA gyrase subunit B